MKKNDKIIVTLGVVILILASVGIYYYNPVQEGLTFIDMKDFEDVNGILKDVPTAITVSDADPFYPLIATPLAVHYDVEGKQEIIPMYVKNFEDTSDSIEKLQNNYLDNYKETNLDELEHDSIKNFSLKLAEKYWMKSDAALLIKNNFSGYSLGVNAIPIASYLSIPVIVCNEVDSEVVRVLTNLGVKKVIVCGDFEGYRNSFSYLEFNTVDEIIENAIYLIKEKFGEIDYITLGKPNRCISSGSIRH